MRAHRVLGVVYRDSGFIQFWWIQGLGFRVEGCQDVGFGGSTRLRVQGLKFLGHRVLGL